MKDLAEIRDSYISEGLLYAQAEARSAQDAMLDLIAKSSLSRNATIKGGVLMQHISNDMRRATTDFDLDFIRYSISDESIKKFLKSLNEGNSAFSIELTGRIEELKHQDYSGKRVHVLISDANRNEITTKVDIGVHSLLSPEVEEICFDFGRLDESVTLLGDSNEQVVAEKLKSLLRIGAASTRYKDIFDIYYLLIVRGIREDALSCALQSLIFNDDSMWESDYSQICSRLQSVFENRRFSSQLANAKNNWLDVPHDEAMKAVLDYFKKL